MLHEFSTQRGGNAFSFLRPNNGIDMGRIAFGDQSIASKIHSCGVGLHIRKIAEFRNAFPIGNITDKKKGFSLIV